MNDPLPMSDPEMWPDSSSATGSPELQDGDTPCNSPDGRQTSLFGPPASPASPSALPERERVLKTQDISGRYLGIWLQNFNLASFLANRLVPLMAETGSPLYRLTYKKWDMSPLPPIFALRGSVRPISVSAFTGWLTVRATEAPMSKNRRKERNGQSSHLIDVARLAGWRTPVASQGGTHPPEKTLERIKNGMPIQLRDQAMLAAGWSTPRTKGGDSGSADRKDKHRSRLEDQVHLTGWLTPKSRDWKDGASRSPGKEDKDLGKQVHLSAASTDSPDRFQLNPEFTRWLQGYPDGWTPSPDTEIRSYRFWQANSSGQ